MMRISSRETVSKKTRAAALFAALLCGAWVAAQAPMEPVHSDFYPAWAATAKYNHPLWVRDTDSALGRRNLQPKRLTLRDAALVHGHFCDGLVISWIELGAALRALFPDGIVDRTDLRVVSKNGPCWVDVAAWATGARINHHTLVLDDAVGDGFIVQRVSNGATVRVSLRPGIFPADLAGLERSIRARRARRGEEVNPEEIDRFEAKANDFILKLLKSPPETLLQLEWLGGFKFPTESQNPFTPRSDVINRDVRRAPPHKALERHESSYGCSTGREKQGHASTP
jgi:formylmethanofuran dehydrogenase subunit E